MDINMLISAILITLYFFLGSTLEDNKLVAEFGEKYDKYRKAVPGIIPWFGRSISRDQVKHWNTD